tara:strand:- start:227 stop:478 length:252 start_codon:yes stop_codon:yes gene_type:complete
VFITFLSICLEVDSIQKTRYHADVTTKYLFGWFWLANIPFQGLRIGGDLRIFGKSTQYNWIRHNVAASIVGLENFNEVVAKQV